MKMAKNKNLNVSEKIVCIYLQINLKPQWNGDFLGKYKLSKFTNEEVLNLLRSVI